MSRDLLIYYYSERTNKIRQKLNCYVCPCLDFEFFLVLDFGLFPVLDFELYLEPDFQPCVFGYQLFLVLDSEPSLFDFLATQG